MHTGPVASASLPRLLASRAYGATARPNATPERADALDRLVAGSVRVAADPDAAPLPAATGFALYTRAADRIEAAVRVTLGQRIDARA